jgi:hypothetical protein
MKHWPRSRRTRPTLSWIPHWPPQTRKGVRLSCCYPDASPPQFVATTPLLPRAVVAWPENLYAHGAVLYSHSATGGAKTVLSDEWLLPAAGPVPDVALVLVLTCIIFLPGDSCAAPHSCLALTYRAGDKQADGKVGPYYPGGGGTGRKMMHELCPARNKERKWLLGGR